MELKIKTVAILSVFILFGQIVLHAQPQSLRPDISVSLYLNVNSASSCIAFDKKTNSIYYGNVEGNVYLVFEGSPNKDTLLFDTLDHQIPYLQGMTFHDSSLFLIGNDWTNGTQGIGIVRKGKLQPNGTRIWTTVLETVLYPATNATFDHGFSGIAIDPAGQNIYISSGSRSDHGELQTAGGVFPGIREVPLTSAIFRIPIGTQNLILPNNDTLLKQGGWLFADGTRNSFGLAFNGRGDLFGVENSGDRDDPEEMNRIQLGKHYGFPWKMGNNWTPQQFPGYNPGTDLLVNKNSKAYQLGHFYNDPTYPTSPGITFTPPLENLGPSANYYRDSTNGNIKQTTSKSLGTFTMHRCPVGLIFDVDSLLEFPYNGNGFMLSFTQGKGDSTGYHPNSIWGLPVVPIDSSEDLIHLNMIYNKTSDTYQLTATRIVEGFNLPVNAELVDSVIYVLEYGSTGNRHIWKISMPSGTTGINPYDLSDSEFIVYPNPSLNSFTLNLKTLKEGKLFVSISDLAGRRLLQFEDEVALSGSYQRMFSIEELNLSNGVYLVQCASNGAVIGTKKIVINH